MTNGKGNEELLYDLEKSRLVYTFLITIVGLLIALGAVYFLLSYKVVDPQGIAAVIGLFTSVLGTIVGAFLGLQIGLGNKADSDARRIQSALVATEAIEALAVHDQQLALKLSMRLR